MAGTARPAALAAVQRYGLKDVIDVHGLLGLPAVDVVYISTPPFLHYEQSKLALAAGKHVICEKPLALTVEQADELVGLARRQDRLLVANLMQRYNPLFDIVGQVIDRQPLGEFLHGYFENYASDENLPPEHWFWDREKSDGIFVEHGVHFFDMLTGWLGAGEVVSVQASRRSDGCEDQVQCTVRYPGGAHFNFYHGFHQPGRLDRQELRLVFERGDMLLQGWVPTGVRIHAVANESQMRELSELFHRARIDVLMTYSPRDRAFYSHGHQHDVYQQFELHWEGLQKMPLYCELLRRRMMTDRRRGFATAGTSERLTSRTAATRSRWPARPMRSRAIQARKAWRPGIAVRSVPRPGLRSASQSALGHPIRRRGLPDLLQ